MTRLLLILIILTTYNQLLCQNNSDYIIGNDLDTLYGFISFNEKISSPQNIKFRTNKNSPYLNLGHLDIKGFGAKDKKYIKAIVEIESSGRLVSNLDFESDYRVSKDTVFLQTFFEGPKALYYLNQDGRENFYIKEGDSFILLKQKKYLMLAEEKDVFKDSVIVIKERTEYLSQLADYLNDCKDISSNLKDLNFTRWDLHGLFGKYYDCAGIESTYKSPMNKIKVDIGLVAGLSNKIISFSQYSGSNYNYLVKANFSKSQNISFGLNNHILFPRNDYKWRIYSSLIYSSFQFDGEFLDFTSDENYTNNEIELNYSRIQLYTLPQIKIELWKLDFTIHAGFVYGLNIIRTNHRLESGKFYTSTIEESSSAIQEPKKINYGLAGGVGFYYYPFLMEYRLEKISNGFSNLRQLSSKSLQNQLIFGITLFSRNRLKMSE